MRNRYTIRKIQSERTKKWYFCIGRITAGQWVQSYSDGIPLQYPEKQKKKAHACLKWIRSATKGEIV